MTTNPFFETWTTPFQAVPFNAIKDTDYKAAFEEGMRQHDAEIEAIATAPLPATFENTVMPLEKSGRFLDQVENVFFNIVATDATDVMRALDIEMRGTLTEHGLKIGQDQRIFKRVKQIYENRSSLGPVEQRLVERLYTSFVHSGAELNENEKAELTRLSARLAELSGHFQQRQIAENNVREWVLETEDELSGLTDDLKDSLLKNGKQRGKEGKHVVTLHDGIVRSFLRQSDNRPLREAVFKAMVNRNNNGDDNDNNAIIIELVKLRQQKAALLNFKTTAEYKFHDRMAGTPAAAGKLLDDVFAPAKATALREADALQKLHKAAGFDDGIRAWDWGYYLEKYKTQAFGLNQEELRQYFTLDDTIKAAFYTANKLFGITVTERADVPVYHPDVRVWELQTAKGEHIGLFYGDFFARATKRGGAWASYIRMGNPLSGQTPMALNCANFTKAEGKETRLTPLEVSHVFHEFGHALHKLLSTAPYPSLYGTNVSWDFVELPSQLLEHWAVTDEIFDTFSRHAETGQPIPMELRGKIRDSEKFGEGYQTGMYIVAAKVDLDLHNQTDYADLSPQAFESKIVASLNLPEVMEPRYRLQHFGHLFAGGYYAGYYSYLWAAVLDTDAFKAFEETGNVFDPATAKRLHDHIYTAGNTEAPDELYRKFRGRNPTIDALLKHRGLDGKAA